MGDKMTFNAIFFLEKYPQFFHVKKIAARFNGRCKCGKKFSVFVDILGYERKNGKEIFISSKNNFFTRCRVSGDLIYECSCGKKRKAKIVVGKYSEKILCDERCMSATGYKCECQCGGKNHGLANE